MDNSHKYKLGEIVIINSLKWYRENCDYSGAVNVRCNFVSPMRNFCGRKAKIVAHTKEGYMIDIAPDWEWSDEMFSSLREIRNKKLRKLTNESE